MPWGEARPEGGPGPSSGKIQTHVNGSGSSWSRLLPSLRSAVAVALLLVLAACGLGDRGSTAQVEGLQYEISVARSLQVGEADLEVYGQVSGYTDPGGYPFADTTAFSLRDVDPRAALLVRWADGLRDDAGSLGEYALLYRDLDYATSGICAYFEPVNPATPAECS